MVSLDVTGYSEFAGDISIRLANGFPTVGEIRQSQEAADMGIDISADAPAGSFFDRDPPAVPVLCCRGRALRLREPRITQPYPPNDCPVPAAPIEPSPPPSAALPCLTSHSPCPA